MDNVVEQTRNGVVQLLNSVPMVGNVYGFEPYAATTDGIRRFYLWRDAQMGESVRGWYLERTARNEKRNGSAQWELKNRWAITGYLSLSHERQSAITINTLVEQISDVLRAQENLLGCDGSPLLSSGIDLIGLQPVKFAGVLCHRARLEFWYKHKVEQ